MAVTTCDTTRVERRGDIAWRRAVAAKLNYVKTVDEIEDRFGLLLDLRDRANKRLEEQLVRLRTRIADTDQRLNFKVLVVESSPTLRTALVAALQRKFHTFGAADLRTALESLREEPDAVLADVALSRTLAASLRQEVLRIAGRRIPLMAICAPENKDVLEHIQDLGLYAAFPKPFRLKEIVNRVEALCADTKGGGKPQGSPDLQLDPTQWPIHDGFRAGPGALEQPVSPFAVAATRAGERKEQSR